jgi:methyl-accepting chemotaxis protein
MRRLGTKLIAGFAFFLVMIVAVGLYSSLASQASLQSSIGQSSVFVASEMMISMNLTLYNWLDRLEIRATEPSILAVVRASNREFDAMESADSYIFRMDSAWSAALKSEPSPAVQRVIGNAASNELRSYYFTHYEKKEGSRPLADVVITNKFGAVVAATGVSGHYRSDGDALWQSAKEKGSVAGDVVEDETSGSSVLPLAARITDSDGGFLGVMTMRIFADSVIRNAVMTYKKYQTTQVKLLTADGKLIYSTKAYKFLEDVSQKEYSRALTGDSGWFVAVEGGRQTLYSFARSKSHLNFPGLPWTVLLGHDVNEVLAPSFALRNNIMIASGILIILGILIAFFLSRSITRPVARLTRAAVEIAKGNLGQEIRIRSKDELGTLAQSFVQMDGALQGISAMAGRIAAGDLAGSFVPRSESDALGIALKVMVENLQGQMREIQEGAAIVVTAASEISASTSQFAANSSETSVAVSQTTATVEEVKQTALLSHDKARLVADKAKRNEEVAHAGRESVRVTTQLIGAIRQQMEATGESIARLNEQSAAIGDITATVSDLADQSNLLAVNAAIEAAKAGEQGKGFAVVAQEIKGLAEQSKHAASQVRKILADIQKAMAAAVMATERGSRAVEQGMKQAEEARESIETIAETVEEAKQAAAQIAASNQQQLIGMDQVATAMESIKATTVQNVAGMKQLEAGAQNLHAVGQKLNLLAEFYRV